MTKKLPVLLTPYIKTRNSYEKLKICRSCNHFTVLGDSRCPICSKSALQPVEQRAASLLARGFWGARIFVLIVAVVGLAFSATRSIMDVAKAMDPCTCAGQAGKFISDGGSSPRGGTRP
jgi:hypothetical protein